MEWIHQMNQALDYIEHNLTNTLSMDAIAQQALCSEYHFTRFFSFITGIPLNEYIRRRKLTNAGIELKSTSISILELSQKYGYESPNSFTRAFHKLHGITPSEARQTHKPIKSYARLHFELSLKGTEPLTYRIAHAKAMTYFGVVHRTTYDEAYESIPDFIRTCEADKITNQIVKDGFGNDETWLSSVISDCEDGHIEYLLGLECHPNAIPAHYQSIDIASGQWAVFSMYLEKESDTIITLWKRIFKEWFPSSGYEFAKAPRIEHTFKTPEGKLQVEAWVPIVQKGEHYDKRNDLTEHHE